MRSCCDQHTSEDEKVWKCGSVTNRNLAFAALQEVQSHLQEVQVLHAHSQSCGRDRKEIVVHVVASPENGCRAGRAPARATCRTSPPMKLLSIFPLSRAARAVRAVRVTSQFRHSSRGRHSDAVRRFVQPQPGDGQHPPPGVQDVNARDESESAAEMSQSEKVRFFSDAIRLLTYFHES